MREFKELGVFLTEARDRCRLQGQELAKLCGVQPASISQIEKGKQKPEKKLLDKLAFHLSVDPIELYIRSPHLQIGEFFDVETMEVIFREHYAKLKKQAQDEDCLTLQ